MDGLLETVNGHKELVALDDEQMKELSGEVRRYIVDCLAKSGGHLASNLGTVEITLALLAELDPDVDRIVWDVGHQSYTFKMLTGRKLQLSTIRSMGGPSGFPSMKESVADSFGTGHASTSLSAALGLAVARRISGADYYVAAVLGDGALTGGMAYEAMNNAGTLKEDLIVILNDNEMAISSNMGSISELLRKVRFSPGRRRFENWLKHLLSRIPVAGDALRRAGHLIKRSLKGLLLPKMFFEEMGFTYIGPLDGHNIRIMRNAIGDARRLGGPVLIHAVTKKGKGCSFAEDDPDSFHGTGPFDPANGFKRSSGEESFTDAFSKALEELAAEDSRVVAISAAMAAGTGLKGFAGKYPGRFFDVGIAEEHAVTFAAGLAAKGAVPVVALYSTFLQRAFDQMVHDVALQGLHVVFCVDRAGIVGEDGATHQGGYDNGMASAMPGFTVLAPRDGGELRGMLRWAAEESAGPVLIRYPKAPCKGDSPTNPPFLPGRAEIMIRGTDIAFICAGTMSNEALKAAQLLRRHGIAPTVMDVRSIKPLDEAAVSEILGEHRHVIVVEEGVSRGGLFSAVALLRSKAGKGAELSPVGMPERPILHGSRQEVLRSLGLDAESLSEAALRICRGGEVSDVS